MAVKPAIKRKSTKTPSIKNNSNNTDAEPKMSIIEQEVNT